ncbi:alpha/beta-Hydrolases superfamily protein isoform X6 [Carex rostrata]
MPPFQLEMDFLLPEGNTLTGQALLTSGVLKGNLLKLIPCMDTMGRQKIQSLALQWAPVHNPQLMFSDCRWFCVESGSSSNPSVVLAHGFPSQAYSYRKVLPVLSQSYHATAFDWLGFGFSDKPQPKYGFDYTLDEYTAAFESLIEAIAPDKFSLVIQGYFAPIAIKYASKHQDKLQHLILVNPPITDKHAILPSTLALFSNFLLGEIFSQDPLRASDKALMSSGPYAMKEEVAMVYRRPYLTSGSSGFALNAISRAMKKDLKAYVQSMREVLLSESWKVPTSICWGMRDRWLSYEGVEDFCKVSNKKLLELPMAGHHVQEDFGEELGRIISEIIK